MVDNTFKNDGKYVCISHMQLIPCHLGEHHLISNWPTDVAKVLSRIKELKNDTNIYNFIGNKD